ncbi:glycosyltransferase family 2 protein, partial [bacterium]|nr:glycosyltransferase family 2 protein [bacterium]
MVLSVIITTRNRSKALSYALESITKQTLYSQLFEVIIVDNGSTDSTREVVDSFTGQIPTLRYYYEGSPGLHVGRHKGLNEAKSNILVYADDDIEAFPTWLEAIAEAFEDK